MSYTVQVCIGVLPFNEVSLGDCTSGAGNWYDGDSEEHSLGQAFLKGLWQSPDDQLPGSGLVLAETPRGRGLMGAHAY